MTDVTQYKPGDKVSLSGPNGSQLVDFTVRRWHGRLGVLPLSSDVLWLDDLEGWTVTKHEPTVELPTEPGYYQSPDGTFVELDGAHGWSRRDGTFIKPSDVEYLIERSGPLRLLRPVDEVRRETAVPTTSGTDNG